MTEASSSSPHPAPHPDGLSMLEKRRIEAGILKEVYLTLKESHGEEMAKKTIAESVRRSAIEQAQAFAAAAPGGPSLKAFQDVMPLWTKGGALEIEVKEQSDKSFAFNVVRSKDGGAQVLRVVMVDGRRVDLVVDGGRIHVPGLAADNEIRMLAALAVTKLGRDDRLIGLHLTLELMRLSLVQAMLIRDRACGTGVHRTGSDVDALAEEILAVARGPLDVRQRPNAVEQIVRLYGCWRRQLEPGYVPDWSGLDALIDQGLRG